MKPALSGFVGGVIASLLLPIWMLAAGAVLMLWLANKDKLAD